MREIRDTKSLHFSVPMSEKVRVFDLVHLWILYIKLGADIGKPPRLYTYRCRRHMAVQFPA